MSVIVASLQGRFGNQCGQYVFCRALAERFGKELLTPPWIGERVFQIEHRRPDITSWPGDSRYIGGQHLLRMGEVELQDCWNWNDPPQTVPGGPIEFRGYAQTQFCANFYTKRKVQSWLQFRPEVEAAAHTAVTADCAGVPDVIVCHQRRGDYVGYGYPVVSQRSYGYACATHGLDWNHPGMSFLTEEDPTPHAPLPDDLAFVADFYRMVKAPTLLRGNSSFSWLAALLGNGLVLSPVIDGLEGGKEHDCRFVAGNWPRFANFDFVTDLHVAP